MVMVPNRNAIVFQINNTPWPTDSLAFSPSLRRGQQFPLHRKGLICHNGLNNLYDILLLLDVIKCLQCTCSVHCRYSAGQCTCSVHCRYSVGQCTLQKGCSVPAVYANLHICITYILATSLKYTACTLPEHCSVQAVYTVDCSVHCRLQCTLQL